MDVTECTSLEMRISVYIYIFFISQGELADMTSLGIWDPFRVKVQTIKTAVEVGWMDLLFCLCDLVSSKSIYPSDLIFFLALMYLQTAVMLLRIDAIVSGIKKNKGGEGGATEAVPPEEKE